LDKAAAQAELIIPDKGQASRIPINGGRVVSHATERSRHRDGAGTDPGKGKTSGKKPGAQTEKQDEQDCITD